MNAPALSRRTLLRTGALTVGFALAAGRPAVWIADAAAQAGGSAAPKIVDPAQVDSYLTLNLDGTVTLYTGKVDLGQGLRIAMRQMAAEELGIGVDKIHYVEGDTALTPDQGSTAGSNGIQRGGVQVRQAAATARKALVDLAAQRLNMQADALEAVDGTVRPRTGGAGIAYVELLKDQRFDLKLDPKAPLKDPRAYTIVGKPLRRPDVPAKVTGSHTFMHDFTLPGMLHARMVRPPAIGAKLVSVDEGSIADIGGVRAVRIADFLAVVGEDEWDCVRAMRALKTGWTEGLGLPDQATLVAALRNDPDARLQDVVNKSVAGATRPEGTKTLSASYFWPNQSHGSIGPSCAVADVKDGAATIWTASQATHRYRDAFAQLLKLPRDKVRLIYLDGAGCYGMNGHEDAAAEAALLAHATGRPVRLQWMREEEHGWDPKGPPQLLELSGSIAPDGKLVEWRTDMWIPEATRGLAWNPLLAPDAAGLPQQQGIATGLLSQNGDPPYAAPNVRVVAHWLKKTPLRSAPIRSPGKPANTFAVESFVDELAAAARLDPIAFRLASLSDARAVDVIKRVAAMLQWEARPSPRPASGDNASRGRGFAYVHYKHSEAYVAIGTEVAVERSSGVIKVERVVCAHDCGLVINPDGVRAQVEGNLLQTLSRALMEEVKFDRQRVTSVDWSSYPILRFSEAPELEIALIDRPLLPPVGAGEAAAAPVAASLGNAVFDAVGVRLRTVPFTPERVKAALDGRST